MSTLGQEFCWLRKMAALRTNQPVLGLALMTQIIDLAARSGNLVTASIELKHILTESDGTSG